MKITVIVTTLMAVISATLAQHHRNKNHLRNRKFHLKDTKQNQYLKIEAGSMIMTLVNNFENGNYNDKFSMDEITWFTGCNNFKSGNEDEICQAQNEIKRLYYDQKHQIFIFLEPKYAIENHHVCHIKVFGESVQINCGVGNLTTKRSHSIIIGNQNTRRKGRRKTFYHMENSSYHPHSQRRTYNV